MITVDKEQIKAQAVDLLKTVYDPEIPVNIYELGLIYDIDVNDDDELTVTMTLTAPNCPVAVSLPAEVEEKMKSLYGITDAHVEITWDPPWDMSKMSDEARLQLGLM